MWISISHHTLKQQFCQTQQWTKHHTKTRRCSAGTFIFSPLKYNSPLYGSSSLMDSSTNRDVSKVLQHNGTEKLVSATNHRTSNVWLWVLCASESDVPAASHVPHCVSSSSQDQQRNLKALYKLHTLSGRHINTHTHRLASSVKVFLNKIFLSCVNYTVIM